MISRIASLNNLSSGFLKYTAYRIYTMKSHLIILCICTVLGFPLLMLALSVQMNYEQNRSVYDSYREGINMFLGISVFLAFVSAAVICLLTYTGGVNCYDYFNRREKVDKSWSLPIKSRHRFWGDFTAGIMPVSIAYILSSVVGLVIMAAGFPKQTLTDNPTLFPMIAAGMLAGLLTLWSIYIIAVFCAALCGRVYETVVYPALIIGIIPALIGLAGTMMFLNVWQIDIGTQLFNVLAATSPGGFFVCFIIELTRIREVESIARHLTFLNPLIIIPFILINAGFLTGAFYLAKKRGAEKTGQPFVFKRALEILISLVVFCITAVFCLGIATDLALTPGLLFGLIMCTAIAFLILDVSAKRGFKRMGRAFFRYTIILTCSIVLSNALLLVNGFGVGTYVPPLNRIESASINVGFLDSIEIGAVRGFNQYASSMRRVEFKDREAVELIRQLNIESNENPYNNDPNNRRHVWLGVGGINQPVTYTLTNGSTVRRNVRLNEAQAERLLPLIMSEDYKKNMLSYIDDWRAGKVRIEGNAQLTSLSTTRTSFGSANTDVFRLYEAFKADYLAETVEQRFNSTGTVIGSLALNFNEMVLSPNGRTYQPVSSRGINIYVLPHYKNLIGELERQGFDVSGEEGEESFLMRNADILICKSDYIGANHQTSDRYHGSIFSLNYFADAETMERTRELLNQLLSVAQPSHLIQGEGYLLYVNNFGNWRQAYYVIPPAYNHLAEELHSIARRMGHMVGNHYWDSGMEDDWYKYEYFDGATDRPQAVADIDEVQMTA
jgi:hypothetical protein